VVRLQFTELFLGKSVSIQRFFDDNNLSCAHVTSPWVSVGLANLRRIQTEEELHILRDTIIHIGFPHVKCTVDRLYATLYEDILLKRHSILAELQLQKDVPF
jgi:hypothetical protein